MKLKDYIAKLQSFDGDLNVVLRETLLNSCEEDDIMLHEVGDPIKASDGTSLIIADTVDVI